MRRLKTVAIVGVGLIGGSFALAMRRAGAAGRVVGVDRDAQALERAAALGVIDTAAESASEAAAGADLVFVSVPVRAMGPVLHDVALGLGPGAVVTDAGSTKADVVRTAAEELRGRLPQFVPGHPIAGRESSGVEAATAELFKGARVVLTPGPGTAPEATALVRACWEACGARATEMTAEAHDRIFASVSHLPHLLAFGLVDDLAGRSNAPLLFSHAASGFRDFTRIAGSHPEMWRDICVANRVALLEELDAYLGELARLRMMLVEGDGDGLEAVFERARRARNAWAEGLPIRTAE